MHLFVSLSCLSLMTHIDPKCLAQDCLRGIMELPSAKLRKRNAVGDLRELADELAVSRTTAKVQDLSEQAFTDLHGQVLAKAHRFSSRSDRYGSRVGITVAA